MPRSIRGAYAQYNWELFLHVPMLIAERLRAEARHEEAQRWYHYVFNPLTDDATAPVPRRFWSFVPFRDNTGYQAVSQLVAALGDPDPDRLTLGLQHSTVLQVEEWERRPFYRILPLRRLAGQKNVVMRYVQNLIDWGDMLFRRFTMESVNEATQLYVLAAQILGDLRSANYRKTAWKPALRAAGFDESLRIHDLRATAASLMIAAGASIKAVQRALGHASAKVTLDTYAGLFEDDLEALADRLDERLSMMNVAPVLPALLAEVRELHEKAL